jgi:hypothetical protein
VGEEEGSGLAGVTLPLDRAALSVALGRDNVVHLAMTESGNGQRLAPLLARLNHYLAEDNKAGGNTAEPDAHHDDAAAGESPA